MNASNEYQQSWLVVAFGELASAMYRTKQATSVSRAGSWSPLASLRVQSYTFFVIFQLLPFIKNYK